MSTTNTKHAPENPAASDATFDRVLSDMRIAASERDASERYVVLCEEDIIAVLASISERDAALDAAHASVARLSRSVLDALAQRDKAIELVKP